MKQMQQAERVSGYWVYQALNGEMGAIHRLNQVVDELDLVLESGGNGWVANSRTYQRGLGWRPEDRANLYAMRDMADALRRMVERFGEHAWDTYPDVDEEAV